MRSLIHRGKLQPPETREDAEDRVGQLRAEIQKISGQLGDTSRINDRARYPTQDAYEDWAMKARAKRRQFRAELAQLDAWLLGWAVGRSQDGQLVEDVRKLLGTLVEDDVDLSPEERDLVDKFRAAFRRQEAGL
jgi:hypothetical protein